MDLLQRSTYAFELPESLIAADPLPERTDARLLVVKRDSKTIEHWHIRDLPHLLPARSVLVANNTRVFRARLLGSRLGSSGKVEFFLLKKLSEFRWQGLIKSSAKVAPGFEFTLGADENLIHAKVEAREDTNAGALFTVLLSKDPLSLSLGEVPLPPYIVARRAALGRTRLSDLELETYNTTFAKNDGSVAAPTAGRHFTADLIAKLKDQGIGWEEITLHVGLGTFKPVMAQDIRDHLMHGESSYLSPETVAHLLDAKKNSRPIIAVGTTSTRTLEGRATRDANRELALEPGEKNVNIFIHPESGHEWLMVDGILTNFHLPESTLLMMIAAFIRDFAFLKQVYETAIAEKYRFYSYGDAMLILPG